MSRVFVAHDLSLDRDVVVKVLSGEQTAGVSAERFRREIQVIAKLQHPHVVSILSAGTAGDSLYYVMPFVSGETLRARITREGPLPVADVVRLLREVLDALAFAHDRGVVHRDIKPENVLIGAGHAVVADFGIAKALAVATHGDSAPRAGFTSVGLALGTPTYMAPEQATADPDDGPPRRSVRGGRAGLRAAHRRAAVRRQHAADHRGAPHHATHTHSRAPRRRARRTRRLHHARAGEGSGRATAECTRDDDGTRLGGDAVLDATSTDADLAAPPHSARRRRRARSRGGRRLRRAGAHEPADTSGGDGRRRHGPDRRHAAERRVGFVAHAARPGSRRHAEHEPGWSGLAPHGGRGDAAHAHTEGTVAARAGGRTRPGARARSAERAHRDAHQPGRPRSRVGHAASGGQRLGDREGERARRTR